MAGTSAPEIPECRDVSLVGERVARTIYTAHHDRLERPVAITVYPPLADPGDRERFDAAAAAAHRLGAHPSILALHEWGVGTDGTPWIATDTHVAEAADQLLVQHGPLDREQALQVGVLLAGAVETAHRSGILHGDIAPAQVVFGSNGEPLLAETGLTRFATLTGLDALMAPIRYHTPPEVLEGTAMSPATDVYSLASTIYALLTGRAPHEKPANITDSNASLLLRILQLPVPPIDRPDTPAGLDEALRAAMAPQAARRPQQAVQLGWALQDVQRRAGLGSTEPVLLDDAHLDRLARNGADQASATTSAVHASGGVTPRPVPDLWATGGEPPSPVAAPGGADEAPVFPQLTDAVPPLDVPDGAGTSPAEPGGALGAGPTVSDTPDTQDTSGGADHDQSAREGNADAAREPADHTPAAQADTVEAADAPASSSTPGPPAPDHTADIRPSEPLAPAAPLWQWSAPTTHPGPEPERPGAGGPPGPPSLPAWYTDPLPNQPGTRGHRPVADRSPPHPSAPSAFRAPSDAATPPPGDDAPWATRWNPLPTDAPRTCELGTPRPGHDQWPASGPHAGGDNGGPPDHPWPASDPVGPPTETPALDPTRPAGALGPGPPIPRSPAALGNDRPPLPRRGPFPATAPPPDPAVDAPPGGTARGPAAPLPRRTGTPGASARRRSSERSAAPGVPAPPPEASLSAEASNAGTGAFPGIAGGAGGRPGSALERARRARAGRLREGSTPARRALPAGRAGGSATGRDPSPTPARGVPAGVTRRVTRAAAPTADGAPGRVATGPPALPVIVLVVVVVVLALGAAWVIITGDEAPPPAQPDAPTGQGAGPAGDTAGSGSVERREASAIGVGNVTATATASAAQLAPEGPPSAGSTVRVIARS
jgi:serine/threonine protein kinase